MIEKINKHIIDCDADPFIPEGWVVVEHKKMGIIKFDPRKISLWYSNKQRRIDDGYIGGHELRDELADKPTLNAYVLDYLLANQHLIPEAWRYRNNLFFWGTIYHDPNGDHLYIRCLHCLGWGWCWYKRCLNHNSWLEGDDAVLLKDYYV